MELCACAPWTASKLAPHVLFTVKEFGLDTVLLVATHPPDLKGKYVEVMMPQWAHMFKMVNDKKGNHDNSLRVLRVEQHDDGLKVLPPKTHPGFDIVLAMQIEDTTPRMDSQTNTAFNVRGTPVVPGDVVRFVFWPDTDNMMHLVVSAEDLKATKTSIGDATSNSFSKTCSMPQEEWRQLTEQGIW